MRELTGFGEVTTCYLNLKEYESRDQEWYSSPEQLPPAYVPTGLG